MEAKYYDLALNFAVEKLELQRDSLKNHSRRYVECIKETLQCLIELSEILGEEEKATAWKNELADIMA